ncbi:MAG: phytoene/squalene synthase family protein [Thermogutta sp.]|nr:phytoene/squalene synthase family protein [Thermogutta terrifontis]
MAQNRDEQIDSLCTDDAIYRAIITDTYPVCHAICQRARSSFLPAIRLLGREQAHAMEIIYAYCRFTDDLADELPAAEARRYLQSWKSMIDHRLGSSFLPAPASELSVLSEAATVPKDALVLASGVAAVVKHYGIPPRYVLEVIEGVEQDIDFRPPKSFAELEQYCARVASAVGVACLYIWGFKGREVPSQAHDCGVAFQLTNILRDLREDAERGRIYIPADELNSFGCNGDDILKGVMTPAWSDLLDFQFKRTECFYQSASELFQFLSDRGRKVFGLMFSTYYALFQKLRRNKHRLFRQKLKLPRWHKIWLLARWSLAPPRSLPIVDGATNSRPPAISPSTG